MLSGKRALKKSDAEVDVVLMPKPTSGVGKKPWLSLIARTPASLAMSLLERLMTLTSEVSAGRTIGVNATPGSVRGLIERLEATRQLGQGPLVGPVGNVKTTWVTASNEAGTK
jgi:hypothetical protein